MKTKPWVILSIPAGNAMQIGGQLAGLALTWLAGRRRERGGAGLLVGGWLVTYLTNHAIAHWAVGRLGGIRFTSYGLHGTTAPDWYPPGVSWVFRHLPLLSARTDPASRKAARPAARAAMYAAGTLWTLLSSLGLPLYARARNVPGATILLGFTAIWMTPMVIVETVREGGDLWRALRELRG
jgi:hypothetical protein